MKKVEIYQGNNLGRFWNIPIDFSLYSQAKTPFVDQKLLLSFAHFFMKFSILALFGKSDFFEMSIPKKEWLFSSQRSPSGTYTMHFREISCFFVFFSVFEKNKKKEYVVFRCEGTFVTSPGHPPANPNTIAGMKISNFSKKMKNMKKTLNFKKQ